MKAYLIDPDKKEVTEVETTGDLKDIYRLLDCHMVETPIHYDFGDTMYCNEEAWLEYDYKNKPSGFSYPNWSYAILGKALIIGDNGKGESDDVKQPMKNYLYQLRWRTAFEMETQGLEMGLI